MKLFLVWHHMIWGAGVDEPHVFRIGGVGGVGCRHGARLMSHDEQSTVFLPKVWVPFVRWAESTSSVVATSPRPPSKFEKNICPSIVLLLVQTWFSSTNNIDWRSKNEEGFSVAKILVLIGSKRRHENPRVRVGSGAGPPGSCTWESWRMKDWASSVPEAD